MGSMAVFQGFNEMQALREALHYTQAQMGEAMGIEPKNAQGTWRRWEKDPSKPASKKAFEKAKEVYRKETGKRWIPPKIQEPAAPTGGAYVTSESFAEWRGYWRKGMEDLLERVDALEDQVRKLRQPGASS
jgi:transcriptional regulator with XRE-family HTH domain